MDDSQCQHMCLMQTNNFYKYKPHCSFCGIFWRWLVMEFQNPAPKAGRLLKTAPILDRSKHGFVWALPRRLQETTARQPQSSASAVGGSWRGGGCVQQPQVGIPDPWASPTAPHGGHLRHCPRWPSRVEPTPNENTLSGKSPCSSYCSSFDPSYETTNVSCQM